ncbi:MAG TPA: uracil-DNA glycosylase family protein [Gemmatimonadaceae bacterium]|nr:uracil-DNA glycosylase family protein [Gemmatimonadaceae bacterium]
MTEQSGKTASTFGARAFRLYTSLEPPRMPRGVVVMNPYRERAARAYTRAFLDTYFGDNEPRTLIFGINPGRFGAGITGVTFTDPVALADFCGIPNDLPRKRELSSVFIYDMIAHLGGPRAFYRRFFLSAISPLGFTRDGVNLNYYDIPELARRVTPFIVSSIERHIAIGGRTDRAVVLGRGKNLQFFLKLNEQYGFFRAVDGLDHPRFIMQYRRKRVAEYLAAYETTLAA